MMTTRGTEALARAAARDQASKTDILNRAAILYDKIRELEAESGAIIRVQLANGAEYRLLMV